VSTRRAAYAVTTPLLAAGWLCAHALGYRLTISDSHERAHALAASGHGYLAVWPVLIALGVAAGLAGLALVALRGHPRQAPWLLALLPAAGFAVQEHLERLISDGGLPIDAALEPSFLTGLLLQAPFALAALLLARALLAGADALGQRLLAAPPVPRFRRPSRRAPRSAFLPRLAPLVLGRSERGPPALPA
jgi:hypothetical protein